MKSNGMEFEKIVAVATETACAAELQKSIIPFSRWANHDMGINLGTVFYKLT